MSLGLQTDGVGRFVGIPTVRITGWAGTEGLRHGFSTRAGGVSEVYAANGRGELNLGFTAEDDGERVRANRAAVLREVGGEAWPGPIAFVRQVHSALVRVVRAGESMTGADGRARHEADGMMTDVAGVLLGVQAADCVPVLIADPLRRAAGAFHAGWRGTVGRIVEHGIAAMEREFGCRPEDLLVSIGPAIGPCCYAVGEDLTAAFSSEFEYGGELFEQRDGRIYLDLWRANVRQATAAGVVPERISVVGECTACTRGEEGLKYFSHRADAGRTGRGMGLIGWEAR